MQVFVGFFCYLTSSFCYRTFEGPPFRTFTRVRDLEGRSCIIRAPADFNLWEEEETQPLHLLQGL